MKKFLYDTIANRWVANNNTVWVYSDPHFGDLESYKLRGIICCITEEQFNMVNYKPDTTYEDFLQGLVNQADEMQIKLINSKVGKNDTIIFLGDIGDVSYIKRIKGYKVLIMGNHDKGASNYKRNVESFNQFSQEELHIMLMSLSDKSSKMLANQLNPKIDDIKLLKRCEEIEKKCDALRQRLEPSYNYPKEKVEDNHLFDEVYEGPLMINDRVILSHEPIFPTIPFLYNIHGHVHNAQYKGDEHHLNCCAEAIDYKPINLLSLMKNGTLKNIKDIHRLTIDDATTRKKRK